jgi:hypothetical protein
VPIKPKYPTCKLTKLDKEVLDNIILIYLLKSYSLIEKYGSPKKFAKRVISKKLSSDSILGLIHSLAHIKNAPVSHEFTPAQLNKILTEEIFDGAIGEYMSSKGMLSKIEAIHRKFIHSRDLRERVLEPLEAEGILLHRDQEQAKKSSIYQQQGKRKSVSNSMRDRGGMRSVYTTADHVNRLKGILEKPASLDYLLDRLIKSGLAYKTTKFFVSTALYAMKMDERRYFGLLGVGEAARRQRVLGSDIDKFKTLHNGLEILDDRVLEEHADRIAKVDPEWPIKKLA